MSTREVAIRDVELVASIESMRAKLEAFDGERDRAALLSEIKEAERAAENTVDMFRMELRGLSTADKKEYQSKLRKHKSDLKEIRMEIKYKEDEVVNSDLMGDAAARMKVRGDDPDLESAQGLMDHGLNVQAKSKEAAQRMVQKVDDTKDIARDVAAKVQSQTEQLEHVHRDLYEIQDTMERAKAILKRMARRAATNRYLWCLILLIICGLGFIIAWEATGQGDGAPDDRVNNA